MIYIVTYRNSRGRIAYLSSRFGLARHTTKYGAEDTARTRGAGLDDVQVRPFKSLLEASRWVAEQNGGNDGPATARPSPCKSKEDVLYEALERIASGQEMTGNFTHADTVLRYQEIARAAIAEVNG